MQIHQMKWKQVSGKNKNLNFFVIEIMWAVYNN